MSPVPRTDNSLVGRWWWTVDRWLLSAVIAVACIGALMVLAASPPVAERLELPPFHFFRRHLVMLVPAAAIIFGVSMLSQTGVRRLAVLVLAVGLVLLAMTLIVGIEIKGARRWLTIAGFSVQPSEFVKPAFIVLSAWLFTMQRRYGLFPGDLVAVALLVCVVGLLALQPDFGMAVTVCAIWGAQYFMAGLPLLWVVLLVAIGVGSVVLGYNLLPHVKSRIDRFFDPASGDSYQVDTSLRAFSNGGLFGRGPGEGVVKDMLPDAHADFIFAVVGEEFGLIACLAVVGLFAFIVVRGLAKLSDESDLFILLGAGGLVAQFGLQAMINMAVTLHLVPTKGMTLPFISYGGSSLLALALGMGMLLALTRRRPTVRGPL